MYVRCASAAVIVYDTTIRKSFEAVKEWVAFTKEHSPKAEEVMLCLVGSKADMKAEREVTLEEGQAEADRLGATFMEVSAKEDTNIDELFRMIATSLVDREEDGLDINQNDSGLDGTGCGC
ncbi:small GTPase superfamily, Rho type [Kipferlia bialata]|uniref:Small GTPase superfamily, Rho type n=1 Tax=Kipferlia bialata TaxID=797122 RepID=A0A9K3D7A0_9EUKA|nr:small GTPase superfamily, Rho type [Kipferlia bialata]|eukprot:g12004.t1